MKLDAKHIVTEFLIILFAVIAADFVTRKLFKATP